MAKKPIIESASRACRHLGQANDPFQHVESASGQHRCYLWMQRDMIDQDHQENYCLSGNHAECPWLQISLPCQSRGGARWGEARTFGDLARNAIISLAHILRVAGARAAVLLGRFLTWAWTHAPDAIARIREALAPLASAALRSAGSGGIAIGRSLRGLRTARRSTKPAIASAGEDLPVLMQLGREANKAGRRKEAHLCFSKAVALDASSEEAWLWMAATAEDPAEAQSCLEKALAINPASAKGRTQLMGLARPSVSVPQDETDVLEDGIPALTLIEQGLRAMDQGNEDRAHHFFAAATEADRSSESAWFWRAKTATDLGEVITSLERVLELNPKNQKAQASLNWALDRQRSERDRERLAYARPQAPYTAGSFTKPEPPPPPGILHFASMGYLLMGMLWAAPAVLLLLDDGLASLYHKIGILPTLKLPHVSSSAIELTEGLIPEFNLLNALPIALALLCFVTMETLGGGRRVTFVYVALVTAASVAAASLFVPAQPAMGIILVLSCVSGVSALAGRVIYQRKVQRQNCGASDAAAHRRHMQGLAPSGALASRGVRD